MKKILVLLSLALLCSGRTFAASTDIVPRGSALLDAFAALARVDAFGAADTPEDFLGEPLYTRGQLARRLEHLVQDDPQKLAKVQASSSEAAALHAALSALQPELTADGVDYSEADTPVRGTSVSGYVSPEARLRTGGDGSPGTGALGIYRVTALGTLRSNLRYVLSASNWPQDERRVFSNDIGAHDFSALNEAYLELSGGRGLTVSLGRMNNRWGAGYRGDVLVSDNPPAMNQIQIALPFSLGPRFGRNYRYTQFASTFQENGTRKYFEGRRIEYTFSSHLTADFQEAFKSSNSKSLELTPFPVFYVAQGSKIIGLRSIDSKFNAFMNFGLSYSVNPDTRFYGQFGIDDIQSPGHQSYRTPRKIAYLVGTSLQPGPGTNLIAEYSFADPTTYTSRIPETQWQNGSFNEIGLPTGPNGREIFLRLSQRLAPGLTVALQGREKKRHNDSFPVPNSRDLAASLDYALSHHAGLQLTYHDYRQEAFPLDPSIPVPGDGFTPANAEGFYGQNQRIKELDVAYRLFF